jgi:hypothetical protein
VPTDIIRLRYADACSKCSTALPARTQAHWEKATKAVTCLQCDPVQRVGATEILESIVTEEEPSALIKPESGEAGASARTKYERLHQKRDEMLDRRYGRFAGVVKFLSDDPQSTRAWAKGSSGEQLLAAAIEKRIGDRAVILNDRKIPRSSANIDHLVIASTGVWVIDAKKYTGRLQRRDKGGWRKIDYHVYVNGRDQTKLVGGLHKQAAVVRTALGDLEVPIHSAICFVEAEWDFFLKPFQIESVWITYGRHLSEMIGGEGPLSADRVLEVGNELAAKLPPKVASS